MTNLRCALSGIAAFLLAHGLIRWQWAVLSGSHRGDTPWFLNATGAIFVTAVALTIAGVVSTRSAMTPGDRRQRAVWTAVGGIATMIVVLFVIGPGTIAPIVTLVGAVVVVAATLLGGVIGSFSRRSR